MAKPMIRLLSDEEVRRMRAAVLGVLEEYGVEIIHDEAQAMLESHGAKVDKQTNIVRIPAALSEQCNRRLPKEFVLGGRNVEDDMVLAPDCERCYGRPASGEEYFVDPRTLEHRKINREDVKDWAILLDALENIDILGGGVYNEPGLNLNARDVRSLAISLENTSKHIFCQPYGKLNQKYMIELGIAERGSAEEFKKRPRFSNIISSVPPLQWHKNSVDLIIQCGKYGIPVKDCPMPICGAAAPVTLPGCALMTMAEHMACVVITQLFNPNTPVIFGEVTTCMDMKSGTALLNSIENAILSPMMIQVGREGFGWHVDAVGPLSDSAICDGQAMIEACFNTILASLAGPCGMMGAGNLETGNILDPMKLVIDDEIFGMVHRMLREVKVDDDTLGLDVIERVGIGSRKNYLVDEHTRKHFKTEFHKQKLFTHLSRALWDQGGRKDIYQRAQERVLQILEEHKPMTLDGAILKEIRAISERAEAKIKETTTV